MGLVCVFRAQMTGGGGHLACVPRAAVSGERERGASVSSHTYTHTHTLIQCNGRLDRRVPLRA